MKINRKNYELYFVDYLDNNLSRGDLLEFMAFLAENPDLEEELNLVKEIKLEPETISFNSKNNLKKTINEVEITKEKFDELCIGKIENNLNKDEIIILKNQFKLHPELEKEFKLFELTILKPDLTIEFSAKDSLKQIEITTEQINQLCINIIENKLSSTEVKQFNKLQNNTKFKKEFELFNQTILKPDTSIVFPHKSSLKRKTLTTSKIVFTRIIPAVAAVALLVLIAFNSGLLGKQTHTGKMFANSNKPNQITIPQKQKIIIDNSTNKNFAITNKKQIKTNNTLKAIQYIDTLNSIAHNNQLIAPDTSHKKQNVIEKSNLINVTNNYTASNNNPSKEDLNKPMEAVFASSKYSHFRDMIESVPYASITAKNSGIASIGVWDVVEAGSKGLEYITGTPISVENKTDKKNHTKHFSFNIGKLGFSRTTHI